VADVTPIQLLAPGEAGPDNPLWHKYRAAGISASDVAAALGVDPWTSPFTLHWRKRWGDTGEEDNPYMKWGRRYERVVREEFVEAHGEGSREPLLVGRAGLYAHPGHTWLMASPDDLVWEIDQPGMELADAVPVEYKTTVTMHTPDSKWGPPGTDEVPVNYRAQSMTQQLVLGARYGLVAVLDLPSRDYREYRIPFDVTDATVILNRGRLFLEDVETGMPPPIDELPSTRDTLIRLFPELDDEVDAIVPAGFARALIRHRAMAARVEALGSRFENRLRAYMGASKYAVWVDGDTERRLAVRSRYPQTRLSLKRMPGAVATYAAARYGKSSTIDKITPARGKRA
jgi:putative phage-type endonuclease